MLRSIFSILYLACAATLLVGTNSTTLGQDSQPSLLDEDDSKPLITMSEKGVISLQGLVQWFAQEKQITITADANTLPDNTKNSVRFYGQNTIEFTPDSALEIVQSILRTNGLALVNSEVNNIQRIVKLADVRPYAPVVSEFGTGEIARGTYVTGVFSLEHVSPQEAVNYIKQMLYTSDNSFTNFSTLPKRKALIVSETDERLVRIAALLKTLDVPEATVFREFYSVKNVQAIELKQQLDEIFNSQNDSGIAAPNPVSADSVGTAKSLRINAIVRTNQLLISGPKSEVLGALEIAAKLDVETNLTLVTYRFTNVSAKQIDELLKQSLQGMDETQMQRVYQAEVNEQANELVANTQPQIHARVEALKNQLDVVTESGPERSPMRFYTLKNVKAIDIVDTLQSIDQPFSGLRQQQNRSAASTSAGRGITSVGGFIDDRGFQDGGQTSPFPGLGNRPGLGPFGNSFDGNLAGNNANQPFGTSVVGDIARLALGSERPTSVIPGDARITVDENTNTLIIVADPATQQLYAKLIEKLDVRRPQVLIEVTIVTLTRQDDYNLGIEISGGDRDGDRRLLGFTNFDSGRTVGENGFLTINPSLGFNGALIDPQTADLVIKALAQHQTARVTAAPRILVNDNATGLLSSTEEVPFSATTSNSVATSTSVGGFLQAGTTINVTPQISEDDYLNLDFDILVNDFSGTTTAEGLPPGRNTNQVTSSVSIPDGHTVVVGGLSRKRRADDLTGLPIIEHIPILNRLTSSEVDSEDESKLFVFIKPIILRDDKFRDLRFLSGEEQKQACIPGDFPSSSPVLIR
jgi:type II secretory pathway component GspD/PulD (secretin)